MTTIEAALREARRRLAEGGVPNAACDARLLLEAATGLSTAALASRDGEALTDSARRRFEELIGRRVAREPVARILGEREFWGLAFALNPAGLAPRPETEGVVEAVLDHIRNEGAPPDLSICDLGAGTGVILIALLAELPWAHGVAVDLSGAALDLVRANAVRHGVAERLETIQADFADPPRGPYNFVVSNPPYIKVAEIAALDAEVRDHDPFLALNGGADGLDAYRAIAPRLPAMLKPEGVAVLELGFGQTEGVSAMLREAGLADLTVRQDLSGINRVLVARGGPDGSPRSSVKKVLESRSGRVSVGERTGGALVESGLGRGLEGNGPAPPERSGSPASPLPTFVPGRLPNTLDRPATGRRPSSRGARERKQVLADIVGS